MNRIEKYAAAFAILVHVSAGAILVWMPPAPPTGPKVVEFSVQPPAPVAEASPRAPDPTPPQPHVAKRRAAASPVQPIAPKPIAPIFGVSADSIQSGDSAVAVPVGNTTMMDPPKAKLATTPIEPQAAAPPAYHPVSEAQIKTPPEFDADACGIGVDYPRDALAAGIEGTIMLRIELDERGQVHGIRVRRGLGHGLDEYAMQTMKSRRECRFKPALDTNGKPVAYVIANYAFRFELPR